MTKQYIATQSDNLRSSIDGLTLVEAAELLGAWIAQYSALTTKEKAQKLAQEERDRAEFLRLQAKFGEKK